MTTLQILQENYFAEIERLLTSKKVEARRISKAPTNASIHLPGYEGYYAASSRIVRDFGLTHDIIQTVLLGLDYSPSTVVIGLVHYFNSNQIDEAFERFFEECTVSSAVFSHPTVKGEFVMK